MKNFFNEELRMKNFFNEERIMKNEELPRGLRNCNPGNIRLSKDKWKGLREVQTDREFFQFKEMKWGYRAMLKVLRNYRKSHGCQTLADMIRRYAPHRENDTNAYINAVCQKLGIPPFFVPDIDNKAAMCMIVSAMSFVENDVAAEMEDIDEGWELL